MNISAANVKLTGSASNVQIVGRSGGGQNLWLDGVTISNTDNLSAIKFQGSNNTLVVGGTVNLSGGGSTAAVINVGGGTTIQGTDTNLDAYNGATTSDYLTVTNTNSGGAGIGSDANGSGGNINIGQGVKIAVNYSGTGAAIGSGANGSIGNINFNDRIFTVDINMASGNAIGYGTGGSSGNIDMGEGLLINITGNSVTVSSGNASAPQMATTGDSTTILTESGIIATNEVNNHQVNVNKTGLTAPTNSGGNITGSSGGGGTTTSTVTVTETLYRDVTRSVVTGTATETVEREVEREIEHISSEEVEREILTPLSPLIIHSGVEANQSIRINFQDMHTKALGLDEINISTREGALSALEFIDQAIEKALDESTNIGAYLARFEHTAKFLMTMNENVQSSESVIRNADMAKEMTTLTKSKILASSSQIMLAHANQNSNNVLGLIQ